MTESSKTVTTDHIAMVALHKCGANLIANLIRRFGYNPVGPGIRDSYAALARQLRQGYSAALELPPVSDAEWLTGHPAELLDLLAGERVPTCMCLHSLPPGNLTQRNLPRPPSVWLYLVRDPRARLVSLISYLTGKATEAYSPTGWTAKHSQALHALATRDDQLMYVIEQMTGYTNQYRTHAWMLEHPSVCTVRFEELVGPEGGGDAEAQRAVIERIARHLGFENKLVVPDSIFDRGSRTFQSGQISMWRSWFTPEHHRIFNQMYGDIVDRYGYRPDGG